MRHPPRRFGWAKATPILGGKAIFRMVTARFRFTALEFEYKRGRALAYVATWDVHQAKVFGLCVPTTGIEPYHRLVDLVMGQEPYRSARRVFWIAARREPQHHQAAA